MTRTIIVMLFLLLLTYILLSRYKAVGNYATAAQTASVGIANKLLTIKPAPAVATNPNVIDHSA